MLMRSDLRKLKDTACRQHRVLTGVLAWLGLAVVSATATAAVPAELVDENLQSEAIRLVGIEAGFVSYFDGDRNLQQARLDDFLLIRLTQGLDDAQANAQAASGPGAFEVSRRLDDSIRLEDVDGRVEVAEQVNADLPEAQEQVRRRAEELKRRIALLEARLDMEDQATAQMNKDAGPVPTLFSEDKDADRQSFRSVIATAYLADGQIIEGRWMDMADSGQALVWHHPLLGQRLIPLDQIRLITVRHMPGQDAITLPRGIHDAVVFRNGDRIEGFIQGVSAEGVSLLPDGATEAITLGLDACQRLEIGTGFMLPTQAAYRLELKDGTVVDCDAVAFGQGRWIITPTLAESSQPTAIVPIDAKFVSSLQVMSSGRVIVPLWQLPLEPAEASVFGLAIPVSLNSRSVVMYAPVRWSWELPVGTRTLSMIARGSQGDWSDAVLSLRVGDAPEPVVERRLTAEQAQTAIVLELEDRRVTVELDAAANGPIMDQVELLDAWIVVERP